MPHPSRFAVLVLALVMLAGVPSTAFTEQPSRGTPGDFDYYTLVLSWSPTHCAEPAGEDDELQCNRRDGRRYAFVLHGLWPQYDRGYPESCPIGKRPFVPEPVIDRMLDIMPSRKLVIHEYRKHGTCSGLSPGDYFETARKMFSSLKIPDRYINPFESQFVNPGDLVSEFLEQNPELSEDMMAVSCGGPGNRLREIRICFTKSAELKSCGSNENQRRMCSAQKMYVPPVRSSQTGPDTKEDRDSAKSSPLPRPRLIPSLR